MDDQRSEARQLLDDHMFGNETEFKQKVRDKAKKNGWLTYAVWDARKAPAGWPDIVLLRGTTQLAWELKMPDGVISDDQRSWIAGFKLVGADARFMYPADWDEMCAILEAP